MNLPVCVTRENHGLWTKLGSFLCGQEGPRLTGHDSGHRGEDASMLWSLVESPVVVQEVPGSHLSAGLTRCVTLNKSFPLCGLQGCCFEFSSLKWS